MTYSIIAFDPESGAHGVAVQSHWFNVGQDCPWVRFGVGAAATQANTEPSYGWRGLDAMAAGSSPSSALTDLLGADPRSDERQVGFIDATGNVAVHTGSRCIDHASHVIGDGWAILGNLLAGPGVIDAMAETFPTAEGTLAERMVATLAAGESAGGDLRGRQSAALRIAPGPHLLDRGDEPGIHISIADHPDPIGELARLVEVDRAYRALRRGHQAMEDGRLDDARAQFDLATTLRHGPEIDFWMAIALARMGDTEESVRRLHRVFDLQPSFRDVLFRLAKRDPEALRLSQSLDDPTA